MAVLSAVSFGCGHAVPDEIPHAPTCSRGTPDVTAMLQRWLDDLPAQNTRAMLQRGCYHVAGTLLIANKTNFTLDGNGATFRAFETIEPPATVEEMKRSHVQFVGNVDVTVQNLTIDGGVAYPRYPVPGEGEQVEWEHQHAFDIEGETEPNNGITLKNVAANRVWGDFVYIRKSSNIEVVNTVFGIDDDPATVDGNGRQGIATVGSENVDIHHSVIYNVARSVMDIEPHYSRDPVIGLKFRDNTVGNTRAPPPEENDNSYGGTLVSNQGASGSTIEDIVISNNVLKGRSFWVMVVQTPEELAKLTGPSTYKRRNFIISNNTSDTPVFKGSPDAYAITIDGVLNVGVWGNKAPVGSTEYPGWPAKFIRHTSSYNTSTVANWTISGEVDLPGYEPGAVAGDGDGERDGVATYIDTNQMCERDNRAKDPLVVVQTEIADVAVPVCT